MKLGGYELAEPWALLLLLAVPLIVWAARAGARRTPRLVFPPLLAVAQAGRGTLARLRWIPTALAVLAVGAAAIALARPVGHAAEARDLSVEGIDVVVALDLSSSMNAVDFQPKDRIHAAKEVLDDFVSRRRNDRIGLVVFAGEAYTQCPLTLDHGVLREILSQVRIGAIPDGTAIGNAIGTSLNRLRDSDAKSRVVILITDGDSNAGSISPMEAAGMAKELGIPVYTILVGRVCDDPEGCRVPFPAGMDVFGHQVFNNVKVAVNPALLEDISRTTGASSYIATDKASLEGNLQQVLAELEKTRIVEARQLSNVTELFDLFLLPALLLGCLEVVLSATRFRRFP
ncbi:VWA domain-containing protein [Vulgatibacter incomptus]|uniref:BatA (Aerotolerance operon) n=1 Tax=Vulgatibacter incomptus TaxID=1391653 RepID=A0A0K1P903_9BACT|nr:VWA domain-containing protein [Vulgatibacter incomptus]AKU89987.1 BatA (aerotolerance operon) [Vulgatibacter incomptus]